MIKNIPLFKFLSTFFLISYITLFLLNVSYLCYQQGSLTPVLTELGNKFLFMTKQLQESSESVIANNGIFSFSDPWYGIKNNFFLFTNFFLSLYTIYIWIKILMLGSAYLITKNKESFIVNFLIAIFIFILLQAIIILGVNAVNKEIDCFVGCDNSVVNSLITPITSFMSLFRALPYLIIPSYKIVSDIKEEVSNLTSSIV